MELNLDELDLVKNDSNNRFELEVNGYTAFIDFAEKNKVITLIHTEAPNELQGTGAARALVEKTLNFLEQNEYTLIPLCPYVFAYIKRHPDWKRIVDSSFTRFQ